MENQEYNSTEKLCRSNMIKECLGSTGEMRVKEQIKGAERLEMERPVKSLASLRTGK